MILWYDTETFSPIDIGRGLAKYATEVEVMIVTWAVDDGPVQLWDATAGPMPGDLLEAAAFCDQVRAHNAQFDECVTAASLPELSALLAGKWYCTMGQALRHGLPGGLDKLCQVMRVVDDSKLDGREFINTFCKLVKGKRNTRLTHPEAWARGLVYARKDINAMRAVSKKMPTWNDTPKELALWDLDQRINRRGIAVDTRFAEAALRATKAEQDRLKAATREATDDMVLAATQRDRLLAFLFVQHGVELPDLKADTVERRLNDPELPEYVKDLLRIRQQSTKSSTAKYKRLLESQVEGRLYYLLQYRGAQRTGRWAGRLFQPQNLPRPKLKFAQIEEAIQAFIDEMEEFLLDNVMEAASSSLRSVLVAAPGKKLVIADLKNIEGRKLAWIAGEDWKLQAYRDYDAGIGPDLYVATYARNFDMPIAQVSKLQRQIGKVCLAGDTLVLCRTGWQRLDRIRLEDEVWDGVEWTRHGGLACNGRKPVLNLCGVSLTPDHRVLCGNEWRPAEDLVSSNALTSRALETAAASLPSPGTYSPRPCADSLESSCVAPAAPRSIESKPTTSNDSRARAAMRALGKRAQNVARCIGAMLVQWPMTSTGDAYSTAWRRQSPDATVPLPSNTVRMVGGGSGCAKHGETTERCFSRTSKRFRDGTTRLSRWIERTILRAMNPGTYASSPNKRTAETPDGSTSLRPSVLVYDLLSVGSRHRFTIWSEQGPLIVHNCELSLGYEGGVGAFATMAATYKLDLAALAEAALPTFSAEVRKDAEGMYEWAKRKGRTLGLDRDVYVACEGLKRLWRDAHPATVNLWSDVQNAAVLACQNPGQPYGAGRLIFDRKGAWLRMRLPSGRYLLYPNPKVEWHGQRASLSYASWNVYRKAWCHEPTYGGKLVENACQGSSCDVMAEGMPLAEAEGYAIELTVHDELVTETPDSPEFTAERLEQLLATGADWTAGLPLAADGYETYRYRKED